MTRLIPQRVFLLALVSVLVLGLLSALAYQQGWHRQVLRYLYARMLQGELVTPGTVRLPPGNSPYNRWLEANSEHMPVFTGTAIDSVHTLELQPWPAMGERIDGMYLRFADYQITDGRLLEIPAGLKTARVRHRYEIGLYFLGGPGHTTIWVEGEAPQRVDWKQGSLISIPLLATYQHFNDSNDAVRLLAVTSFPFVINAFDDEAFAQTGSHEFAGRNAQARRFLEYGEVLDEKSQRTNFVANALEHPTAPNPSRGATNRVARWIMVGNTMLDMHVSEFGPKSHKRAHRHSGDAFILILSGSGFSLTWPEGDIENRQRIDWQPGTLFVPPNYWYHQHFNTSDEPARYLVINPPFLVKHLGLRFYDQLDVDAVEARAEWEQALAVDHLQSGGSTQEGMRR